MEHRRKGFGKLAFFEFLLLTLICTFSYFKIQDGTIKIDTKELLNFSYLYGDEKVDKDKNEIDDKKVKKENEEKESEENNEEDLTMDEKYNLIREKYTTGIPFMYNSMPLEFKTGETINGFTEITNYADVLSNIFTSNGIKMWEEYHKEAIKKENGKIYITPTSGVIGLDYVARSFVKIEEKDDVIKCIVDNMFYNDLWNEVEKFYNPDIKHVETEFVLKRINGKWLIDKMTIPR